jgi:ABC-type transport system involved in multi-copper enzyme maturation permease subunit
MMYFVQMSLLAAVAVTLSTFVTPIVNFFLAGGLYLMGSLFNPFFETISQNANTPPFAKFLAKVVDLALPNFANYNIQNPIINPGQQIGNETTYFLQASVYGIVYILGLLVVGILIFDRREV